MAGLVPFKRNTGLLNTGFPNFYEMMDDFFNDSWPPKKVLSQDTFKLDVQDNENEYIIEADLPGTKKEEINVEMNDGRLTIFVRREENVEEENKNYVHKERRFCSMSRGIYLVDAEGEGIKAKLEDGVLNIVVPKQDKNKTKSQIVVE
ncbi:MAG TPA: Hsp20 family protein [Anaerovoracaceae bacterium]|nr:Hsp20 family protein [Anaerovoracaceae bacterium]